MIIYIGSQLCGHDPEGDTANSSDVLPNGNMIGKFLLYAICGV